MNLYLIYAKDGTFLCYQVASDEKLAVEYACFYNSRAYRAEFIREN